jgi:hypothetical protein
MEMRGLSQRRAIAGAAARFFAVTHSRFSFKVRMKRSATPLPSGCRTKEGEASIPRHLISSWKSEVQFITSAGCLNYPCRTPPYDSGDTKHDQGINKAGNTRARVIAVQMAWLWLRYQSKSELSLWYYRRVGNLKGRVRRIMIIALARKLVIALWRYVETGKVPTGAIVTA